MTVIDKLSNADKLQAVLNTLPLLEMAPTHNNVARMTGIYNTVSEVINDIKSQEPVNVQPLTEVKDEQNISE